MHENDTTHQSGTPQGELSTIGDPGAEAVRPALSEAEALELLRQLAGSRHIPQFLRLRQELLDWNTRVNLTAITDPLEVLLKHFLDSLSLLEVESAEHARVLDIGAGAGFPGLPLKLARPRWEIVLLEATGKKVAFQRHVIETLKLQNIEPVHGRAEELAHKPGYRASFDIVTARAVASLPALLEYAAPFCRPGGRILLPKKGDLSTELEQGRRAAQTLGLAFKADQTVTLPGLADGRRILVWEQVKLCPPQYPRSGSAMVKKPLG
jgi:16S rRNA (guanine527-N7)-methyltransferase